MEHGAIRVPCSALQLHLDPELILSCSACLSHFKFERILRGASTGQLGGALSSSAGFSAHHSARCAEPGDAGIAVCGAHTALCYFLLHLNLKVIGVSGQARTVAEAVNNRYKRLSGNELLETVISILI